MLWRKYSPILVHNLVPIDTGKTHIELVHLNENHFDPVLSSSGVSEPTILRKEHQGGVITD